MAATIFAKERNVAIRAVLEATKVCQLVVSRENFTKEDRSPVTVADFSAQAIINTILADNFPADPIVGEEDSKELKGDKETNMRNKVLELTNDVLKQSFTEEKLFQAIDRGSFPGGPKGRMWALDPIDGTQGFLRGGQYAICLALIVDGEVQVGVMSCPNLPIDYKNPAENDKGVLFVAVRGEGAFQRSLTDSTESRIRFSNISKPSDGAICESFESGHSSHEEAAQIASLLGIVRPPIRMDSQAKYCSISRGDGDIYLRLPVSATYEEKIWDHASGSLLVTEAGGAISDVNGNPLDFTLGRTLKNNSGVVTSHANIHGEVVKAVKEVLKKKQKI